MSSACKRKAQEDMSEKSSKIIQCGVKKNLTKRRKLLSGPLQNSISEVHEIVSNYSPKRSKN